MNLENAKKTLLFSNENESPREPEKSQNQPGSTIEQPIKGYDLKKENSSNGLIIVLVVTLLLTIGIMIYFNLKNDE